MKNIKYLSALFTIVILLASGCDDYNKLTAPITGPKNGDADFTRYVAIGNSITAGYQSGTLFESAQMYSYGNLISKQVNTSFATPWVSDPGLGGRLEVGSLSPFSIYTNPNTGVPTNLDYPAPYNNLGVPGALVYDVLFATKSTDCASYLFAGIPNPYFDLVLRNSVFNIGSQLSQAITLDPTLVTLWIGNNDVLGYATSGGTAPTAPTDAGQFAALFNGIAGTLAQAQVPVVVANIPNVTAIPFFTTVGPQMALSVPWTISGAPGLVYQSSTTVIGIADSASLLTGGVLVTLKGSSYASLLGTPSGKFYRDNGITDPSVLGIDTTQAFGFSVGNPWPNALILDDGEITIANDAVAAFNGAIATAAANFGFGLVDINGIFNSIRQADFTGGTIYNGIPFSTFYVEGGLFSLDGVHPSSRGQAIIANEFIKVINSKFSASIPLIDVSAIPGSLVLASKLNGNSTYYDIPAKVFEHLLF